MKEQSRAALASWKRYQAECRARQYESAKALSALAKTAPERAVLTWLAMPALHDEDGSIDSDAPAPTGLCRRVRGRATKGSTAP